MNFFDVLQILIFCAALILLTPVLGKFMAKVFSDDRHIFSKPLGWFEHLIYKTCGIHVGEECDWKGYAKQVLWFNAFGLVFVFALQMLQGVLPLNPEKLPGTSWHLAFNTAVSFMSNTNWQAYGGEATMSYLTQMLGLAVQNFLSAATGIAVLIALIRGLVEKSGKTLGNFLVDLTRSTVYILLPLSIILAVVLVSQGVVQTFSHYVTTHTLEGVEQVLPLGPAASQIAIKQLGTNGGGFFNVNSAHPFENPTPLSNWLEMLAILLIPAALTYTYGTLIKSHRQGWIIFAAMFLVWFSGLAISIYSEYTHNPVFGVSQLMEGKEQRFGIINSLLWSTSTTVASNGSVNAMHSSLSPLAGGVAMFNMMLGEIIFGGVGCGLYGMILFILMTVFLAGLMVGRTPEYLGKKIESREMGLVLIAILAPSAAILLGSGLAAVLPAGLSSLANKGPHGLSEILYAFTSASQNNGSAFAGLNANVPFYNVALGICMLIGRFAVLIPVLAIAGSLVGKNITPPSDGSFATDNLVFLVLLIAVILIVGALTFFPALCLGPIVEHFLMLRGVTF